MEKKVLNEYPTILVPGFLSVDDGKYNYLNYVYRYFGGFRGDLTKTMRKMGYEFYDPSLGPFAPVWDRVCDMYGYLVGGTVDYGKVHSEKYGHARYGRTYPGVIPDWGKPGKHAKINLMGYSFGGPTVCLFTSLLVNGAKEEIEGTPADELSPLFAGGNGGKVHCTFTLDGTNNGTSAIEFAGRPVVNFLQGFMNTVIATVGDSAVIRVVDFKVDQLGLQSDPDNITGKLTNPMKKRKEIVRNATNDENMFYQMGHTFSKELADKYYCMDDKSYYFNLRSSRTHKNAKGNYDPNIDIDPIFFLTGALLGRYTNKDAGIDESWHENDGIVPLPGQAPPYNMPQTDWLPGQEAKPGIWQILPVGNRDHMTWCGWFITKRAYQKMFTDMMDYARSLPDA